MHGVRFSGRRLPVREYRTIEAIQNRFDYFRSCLVVDVQIGTGFVKDVIDAVHHGFFGSGSGFL